MTNKQKHILFFLLGILLLAMTIFREELFTQSQAGVWAYRFFAFSGLVIAAGNIGGFFNKKWKWAIVAFLFALEIIFSILFNLSKNGHQIPEKITNLLGYIYLFHCRDYIVYDENRGVYDADLFYKLKPGEFEYNNMEFSTKFHVNSKGFRDDEQSLDFPEIIFLGDSYTMGWGVEQDESFSQVFEMRTGKKSLNLGIASYGTAREYLAFEKIKYDSCKVIILQFCPNDVNENRAFVENGFQLNISPKEKFEKEIVWNKIYQVYFPLKYTHSFVSFLAKKSIPKILATETMTVKKEDGIAPQDVEYFFTVLKKIKHLYNGSIIVFNLGMNVTTPAVNDQFEKWLGENKMAGVYVFHSTHFLDKNDYLPLDTHLTKEGNKKLADGLVEFISKKQLLKQHANTGNQ